VQCLIRNLKPLLLVLCVVLTPYPMQASDLYVSTTGRPSGAGTMQQPYDLATALSGRVGQAGDTFWLREGNYTLGHVDTMIQGAPGRPITFRQMPGEKARVDGSISFFNSLGHVILRDFELYSSDTNRASAQTGVGFDVTDIKIIPGIASFAPNLSFINLVVHDQTRHGFYLSRISTNNLIYGCVVYNNGWVSPDNAEGHGLYVQGTNGPAKISDSLVFNNSGANMHIYENASGLRLAGVTLEGNLAFNAGAIQNVRHYRDWIVGVDAPAVSADRMTLTHNMGYYPAGSRAHDQVQIGRLGVNGSVVVLDNYFPLGLWMNNWTAATVASNLFVAPGTNWMVNLDQTQVSLPDFLWDRNSYARSATGKDFLHSAIEYDFSGWQSATGYDQNSSYMVGNLSGTKVFVRPNRYEAGRANIVVYNWDNLNSVSVDVSSVLAPGAAYEVRNAQDFFAPPLLSGVFDGQPLELPMRELTVAVPNGPLLTPPPTGPTFNVFILLPRAVRLQIAAADGQAQLSWPTNSGKWVLQYTATLSASGGWTDDISVPSVDGQHYVVTNFFSEGSRFYRLRATH
jgi:hypothetical protein